MGSSEILRQSTVRRAAWYGAGVAVEVKHPRCPFCFEPVQPKDAKAACDACMCWHHAACWSEHGACVTCGADAVLVKGAAPKGPPARQAPASSPDDLRGWLLGQTGGRELDLARAALAAAERALPPGGTEHAALEPLRAWLGCPCRDHAAEAQRASEAAQQAALLGEGLVQVRDAALLGWALKTPSLQRRVHGERAWVRAIEAAGAAIAARRGATKGGAEDEKLVRAAVEKALA